MKITLKSTNTEHYSSIAKTLIFIPRENEVLITTEDGKEIASLSIQIMDKEDEKTGKEIPSNSFWLQFHGKDTSTDRSMADVYLEV
jgi:hypothetical protein